MAGWFISGYAILGFWRYSGAWVKVTTEYVNFYENVSSSGSYVRSFDRTFDLNFGSNVQWWGVSIDEYDGSAATLDAIQSVIHSIQTASGARSATPGGETVVATVRPQ